jgi:hypothetical protein
VCLTRTRRVAPLPLCLCWSLCIYCSRAVRACVCVSRCGLSYAVAAAGGGGAEGAQASVHARKVPHFNRAVIRTRQQARPGRLHCQRRDGLYGVHAVQSMHKGKGAPSHTAKTHTHTLAHARKHRSALQPTSLRLCTCTHGSTGTGTHRHVRALAH